MTAPLYRPTRCMQQLSLSIGLVYISREPQLNQGELCRPFGQHSSVGNNVLVIYQVDHNLPGIRMAMTVHFSVFRCVMLVYTCRCGALRCLMWLK